MELCNCTDIVYSFNLLSTSLLTYLDALKYCNCQEIETECMEREHTLTSFHDLAYNRFCEPEKFELICKSNNTNISGDVTLARQCLQVSQYERGVFFDEWFIGWSPFCPTYGIGANQRIYNESPFLYSPYNNMVPGCRVATIISMVIFYLLAIVIIIANSTVILVVRLDQYFHTPYGYFKASIAIADLLVGVLVIPGLMYQFHVDTFHPLPFRIPGEFPELHTRNTPAFFISIGFFTILTLSVSVYCLAASSFDRYFSISQPFKYEAKRYLTRKKALIVICVIWLLSAVYGIFPLTTQSTSYGKVSATYILAAEFIEPSVNYSFPWKDFFNSTIASHDIISNHTVLHEQDVQGRSFIPVETSRTSASDVGRTTTIETQHVAQHKNISSSSKGLYLILSMYLLSLFIPLVLVWVVNICTIRAFKKKSQKSKKSSSQQRASSKNGIEVIEHNHSSSSPCVSTCSSVLSIQAAMNEEAARKNAQNLEQHLQTALETAANNNQFLTVPLGLNYGRKSLPNILTHNAPNNREPLPQSSSARSSFSIARSVFVRRKASRQSEGQVGSRMQKILLRMVIAFTISLLPAICSLVLHILLAPYTDPYNTKRYSNNAKLFENGFAYISSVFLFGNSFVNCLIYTVLGTRFREVTRKLYAGKISQIQSTFRRMSIAVHSLTTKDDPPSIPVVVEHQV